MNIREKLMNTTAIWPGRCVDMRLKKNKAVLKDAIGSGHARRICVTTNSFAGSRMAWEFSCQVLHALDALNSSQKQEGAEK